MKKGRGTDIEQIHQLVEIVKQQQQNWEVAFEDLNIYLQPIIRNFEKKFFITDFDDNDWLQEGAIVCYKACFEFNASQGSVFISYFKLLFCHHVISLVRKQNSLKRRANNHAVYLDGLPSPIKEDLINSASQDNLLDEISLATNLAKLIYEFNDTELHYFGNCLRDGLYEEEEFSRSTKRSVKTTVKKFFKDN